MDTPQLLLMLAVIVTVIMAFVTIGVLAFVIRPWVRAFTSGAPVSFLSILGMRLRGNPPSLLIDAYGTLKRAGVHATISEVELTYMDNRTRVRTSPDLVSLIQMKVGE